MPKLLPALAARAAVVATTAAAACFAAVLPATTAAAAPAPALTQPAVSQTVVSQTVAPIAFSAPAARIRAMNFALGKLGAPYRWGAAGPNAFDCSGLLKWSFAQAGINLPRTSRAQSKVGTPVAKANLQPGDAVFFYRPVSHDAIYIGNGKVVHASRAGTPVKIANLNAMPFNSARRY